MVELLLVVLTLNTAIGIGYCIYCIAKKNAQRGIMIGVFIIVAPVVSLVFIGVSRVLDLTVFARMEQDLSKHMEKLTRDRNREVSEGEEQKFSDGVPLEEALVVSEAKDKRDVLLGVLKKDQDIDSLRLVRDTVQDQDSEVSHYAVSFITDIVSQYKKREEREREVMEKKPTPENQLMYLNCLYEILMPRVFVAQEERSYIIKFEQMVNRVKAENPDALTGLMLTLLMELWGEHGNTEKVEEHFRNAQAISYRDIDAVKICMKYYFKHGTKEEFFDYIEEVKASSVRFDNEVLEWIKFYSI